MSGEVGVSPRQALGGRGRRAGGRTTWARTFGIRLLVGWVPPFVGGRVRTSTMRAAGLAIGKNSVFWYVPTLLGSGPIHTRLSIGTDCGFNKGAVFDLSAPITIGNHVAVGHDVMFLTSVGGLDRDGTPVPGDAKPIVIGDGVWLGARATVLPGVTIGAGSVIGAGITVDKDVPENTLLTGAVPISLARWRAAKEQR